MNAEKIEVSYKNQSHSGKIIPYFNKDKVPKIKRTIKQEGEKSEVYAFESQDDVKKVCDYFLSKKMYLQYMLFIIGANTGRREGDVLSLKWKHFFYPDGIKRKNIPSFKEEKTDKLAEIYINEAIWRAIDLYIYNIKEVDICEHYEYSIAYQWVGRGKGTLLKYNSAYKAIKRAAEACGIKYNVGTHSQRKYLGYMCNQLHPNDPERMAIIQDIFNHSSEQMTRKYIGLTKAKRDQYYKDIGQVFCGIMDGNTAELKGRPTDLVSIQYSDLRQLVELAFDEGQKTSGNDWKEVSEIVNNIMDIAQDIIK